MYIYHNIENDTVLNTEQMYARQRIIEQLKVRFSTYGYREISTAIFEKYNLYATMSGTVNHREMIKTIDNTGQVLVLRPDVTIPLTKELAASKQTIMEDLRYFYVLDVFRQTNATKEYKQRTQAGIEYFGNPSVEADAEIIALAAHTLQDLNVGTFTIELGHADFFKQIAIEANLSNDMLQECKRLIQGKNIPEMERLLDKVAINDDMKQVIGALPFLYGSLTDVFAKTDVLPLSKSLRQTLADIEAIYNVLESYGVANHIVIDLSLINHMDYYSDIIFQGFIERIGQTVLMGGRYDSLASHFSAEFPAIGFAFDVDLLLAGSRLRQELVEQPLDFVLQYDKAVERRAITLAQKLRNKRFRVITYVKNKNDKHIPQSNATITLTENLITLMADEATTTYPNESVLLEKLLQLRRNRH